MDGSLFDLSEIKPAVSSRLVRVENNCVRVLDDGLKAKIDKIKLSPSLVSAVLASPGDWLMGKFIEPECIDGYVDALERGSWFHAVMEEFYDLEPDRRDYDSLRAVVKRVSGEKFSHMLEREDNKDWLRRAVAGYRSAWLPGAGGERVADMFIMGQRRKGLELFVSGKIGDVKRSCLGFIDKIIEGDKGLIVQDWKTGASIHSFDPSKRPSQSNSFDYWRQQTFYAMLLQQHGKVVEQACLLFPCVDPPSVVDVDFNDDMVRGLVVKDFEQVDRDLDRFIADGYCFPFYRGRFNGWASYLCGLGSARFPSVNEGSLDRLVEFGDR